MRVTLDDIRTRERQHVLQTYRRQPVAFVRGQGSRLYDADGREYLDLLSGIGVTSLGHAHPGLAAVIAEQAATLLHTSNLYYHPFQAEAAARLSQLSGLQRAFFCNSGTEANEACLKFARRYWHTLGQKDRVGYVAVEDGFGGRTMGALSVTHDMHYREPFLPLIGPVTFVNPEKPETLLAAVGDTTAAIIAEPIRGEGGIRTLPDGFVRAVKDVTAKTGTLLIADEVQSGLGRTGYGVLLPGARLAARPRLGGQGARLGRAGGRGARFREGRRRDLAGRSWQHLRRQPAGVPGGGLLPRAIDGPRPARARPRRGRALRAPAPRRWR